MTSIAILALVMVSGAAFCLAIWDEMRDREAEEAMERAEDREILQRELDEATSQLLEEDYLRRVGLEWSRELDRQRWRVRYREAEHHHALRAWERLWGSRTA